MPIDLPDLADKDYSELVENMLSGIPKYSVNWTDYNPSDPGVAFVELFSWIGESLLYRINNIPYESYVNFLRLFAGLYDNDDMEELINEKKSFDKEHVRFLTFLDEVLKKQEKGEKVNVEDMMAAARKFFYSPYRAISEEDFENLAIEATAGDEQEVKRVIVNSYSGEGKVEVIIVPSLDGRYEEIQQSEELLEVVAKPFEAESYSDLKVKVKNYLNDRKLVGTLIDVRLPEFTNVPLELSVVCGEFSDSKSLLAKIGESVIRFLDPVTGGDSGRGRERDRTLSVYEVAHVAAGVDGIKRVEWIKSNDVPFIQKEVKGLLWLERLIINITREKE